MSSEPEDECETMDKKLLTILIIAFLLRALIFSSIALGNQNAIYDPDSDGYTVMGKALSKGDFLLQSPEAKQASLFRVAGYPAFLGIFYSIGLNDLAIAGVQLLLDFANIYLIYLITKKYFEGRKESEKIAYVAAALYAISPLFVSFFFKILTESLFTTVFLLAIYYFVNDKKNTSSILLGILILIKPVAIFYPIVFAIYNYLKTKNRRQSIEIAMIALAISSIWLVRNFIVLDKITYSAISTVNYVCWNGVYLANDVGLDNPEWKDFIKENKLSSFEECQRRPLEELEALTPKINTFVLANPLLYAKQYVKGAITFFVPTTPNNLLKTVGREQEAVSLTYIYLKKGFDIGFLLDYLSKNSFYAVILTLSVIYTLGLYALFISGLKKLYQMKNYALIFLVITLILYNIVAVGPVANYRFRIPVEPLIILVAASAFLVDVKMAKVKLNGLNLSGLFHQ